MDFNDLRIEYQNRTFLAYSYLFDKYKRGTTLELVELFMSQKYAPIATFC